MRKSEVDIPGRVSLQVEDTLERLSKLQVLGSDIVKRRQEVKELEDKLRPSRSVWLPPKGFLWTVTSASNEFGFAVPARFGSGVEEDGFVTADPEVRKFNPPQPDGIYVFLADSLKVKNSRSTEPGTVYAVGCFAAERVRLSDAYETGVVAVDSLPELIANTPLDLKPGQSVLRGFGVIHGDGLTIQAA